MISGQEISCGENTICDFDEDGKRGCLCKSDKYEGDPYGDGCTSELDKRKRENFIANRSNNKLSEAYFSAIWLSLVCIIIIPEICR